MPLVSGLALLRAAKRERYALGAFNAFNLEMVQGIVAAAVEERAPLILQVSQKAIQYAGLVPATDLVNAAAQEADVPVVLHLDHGREFGQVAACFRAGFTSLMFDGSALPFEENVAVTRQVVALGHAAGIPVEAELGHVGEVADRLDTAAIEATFTDPEEAERFVALTGVDALAVAVGSVHAMTSQSAQLDLDRISRISAAVGIPLVLHGASGVPDDAAREAIADGVGKINVATHLNKAFTAAVRADLGRDPDMVDPKRFLAAGREAVKEEVRKKLRLFGASGKA